MKFNGTVIKQDNTDANGRVCFPNQYGAGTYCATMTWNGITKTVCVTTNPADGTDFLVVPFVDKITVTVNGCDSPLSGATVNVPGCGTNTTGADGTASCTPSTDVYTNGVTITCTYKGRSQTATVSGFSACTPQFNYVDRICGCVTDACGLGGDGDSGTGVTSATVMLSWNGNALGSATPASNGYWCIQPLQHGILPGDTISYTVTAPNYAGRSGTFAVPGAAGTLGGCTSRWGYGLPGPPCPSLHSPGGGPYTFGLVSIVLQPDSAHCCQCACAQYNLLYPTVLHINDGFGDVQLTAGPGRAGGGPGQAPGCFWTGCAIRTAALVCDSQGNPPGGTRNQPVAVSFGFDGCNFWMGCAGTIYWGSATCSAALNSTNCPQLGGGHLSILNVNNFSNVVNSCDPPDITCSFTLPTNVNESGACQVYGFGGTITLHLTA